MKQVHGADCDVAFLVVFSVFHSFSIFSNIEKTNVKECNINSRRVSRTPKMENFAKVLTALLIIVAKLSILDICRGPGYTSGISGI